MVIDSHALRWWLEEDPRLSGRANTLISKAESNQKILYVSAVSFWEIRQKEIRGLLRSKTSVAYWPQLLANFDWMKIESTTLRQWLVSADLEWAHRDPADRLIAALAIIRGVPVLTKDDRFHAEDSPVRAVW